MFSNTGVRSQPRDSRGPIEKLRESTNTRGEDSCVGSVWLNSSAAEGEVVEIKAIATHVLRRGNVVQRGHQALHLVEAAASGNEAEPRFEELIPSLSFKRRAVVMTDEMQHHAYRFIGPRR